MMNTPARRYWSLSRCLLQLAPVLSLLLMALFALEAQAAITATRTSAELFYTNSDAATATTSPQCNYLSFDVTTSTAIDDAWVTLDDFTGGYLSMGGGDDGIFHFGPMDAGETRAVFFYVCSSYSAKPPSGTQSYNLKTYDGKPVVAGGGVASPINASNFSIVIEDDVIEANPNTVNAIWADINPSILGATTTLTVDGDTGTIGCAEPSSCTTGTGSGPIAFNPATFTDWRADAYELVATSIVLSGGNSGTYNNTLYIDSLPSSSTTNYQAIYYFRPVATTASTTTLSPVSYIASGTQIKHTNLGSGAYATAGGLLPILPAKNEILIAKTVSHATLPAQGGTVTYTLSATNYGAYNVSLDSFIDVLPAGATYVPGSTTFNDVPFTDPYINGATLDWSSLFDIPGGATRSLIFQASLPATPGSYTNSAYALIGSAILDTTLATSDYAPPTANTLVLNAPTITKAFSPTALAITKSSTMTLTIGNSNTGHALGGIAVSDSLPAGLVFAAPTNAATSCTSAALNITGNTISITGGTLAVSESCTVSVDVTSLTNGSYTNTTGAVSSSNGGTGGTASADITFSPKPTINKAFSVSTIPLNGTATLTLDITNNTAGALTGMTFDDLFPAGLVTANPASLSSTCGGSVSAWDGATATALNAAGGDPGIQLTAGSIADAAGTCTISIDVTAAAAGSYANTTSGVDSTESTPAGPVSNTAILSVLDPPAVSKAFSTTTIGIGQSTTLTVTLSNPNAIAISGAAFTDSYPTNLINAATTNLANACGGTATATAGGGSLSLAGGTIPAGGSCAISVDVTSNIANSYTNTLAVGDVTTNNAGSNTVTASDTLTVNTTPTINKSFSFNPATGIATMTIAITNNDAAAITNLSLTDLFPVGMSTDNPPSLSPATPCGAGSSIQSWNGTTAGTLSASGGDPGIKLTAGQIAGSGSCSFSINLTVNSLGVYQNQTSGLTSNSFAGTSSASNIATWIAPAISKNFTPTQVTPTTLGPSDISRMVISITNPSSTTTLTGLALTDTYPTTATELAGGTLNAAMTSPTPINESTTCGGVLTATTTGFTFSGGTLAPGASCTIETDVYATDTTPAIYYNTTGNIASDQGIGVSGADSLIITTKPTIDKSFLTSPVTLSAGTATSTMRIVVDNNSAIDITNLTFSDTFPSSPSQMVWLSTDASTCGGTLTDAADAALVSGTSTSIKLTGGAITAAAVTCTIDITVQVSAAGSYYNTTTGATSSANAIVGPVSNTAELVAQLAAPTATKSFANAAFQVDGNNRLTITLSNSNTLAITNVAFTDTYPANLLNATVPNITNTCGGTATAAAGAGTLSISGGTIPAASGAPLVDGSCIVEVDLTATQAGAYTNTLLANSVISGNAVAGPAADVTSNTTAYLPPALSKAFAAATLNAGGSAAMLLTLTNPAANTAAITGVSVDDTFPAGMTLNDTGFTYAPAACGSVTQTDSVTASAAGDGVIRFSVASLAAGASCEVSVNITSSTTGAVTNTTDAPVATAPVALTGITAWDDITVQSAPSITVLKTVQTVSDPVNLAANPKAIPGAVMQYIIIMTNSGAGGADNDSTVLVDPIPANTLLYVDDIGGAGSGPVLFIQGATSSTLNYSFTALNDMADDLSFSNDGGATWNAVPSADATGCDATAPSITHIRINPKGVFIGNVVPPSPSLQLAFRVCVQ